MAYGLRPYNKGSGGYSSGGVTEYPINDGDTRNMFTGSLMWQEATGFVTTCALTPTGATTALNTCGVAVGFRYVDPDGVPRWSQSYTGNAGNTDAFAFIVDDPTQLFLIQADDEVTATQIGLNAVLVSSTGTSTAINQGNSNSGLSTIVLDQSTAAIAATFAVRIVSIPSDGTNETSATPNVVVRINPAVHQLLEATGL